MTRGLIRIKMKDFFFDSKKVIAATTKAERDVLSKYGYIVRNDDKASMKTARQVPISSLPPEQRKLYEPKRGKDGRFLPANMQPVRVRKKRRPLQASRPGEPPRVRKGLLKRRTFFAFDPQSRSVVVGPEKLSGFRDPNVLSTLEEGGITVNGDRVAARPHTGPANKRNLSKLAPMWRNSIK